MNKSMIVLINYEQCTPYISNIYYNADADYRNVVEVANNSSKDFSDNVYIIDLDNKDQAFISEILKRGRKI